MEKKGMWKDNIYMEIIILKLKRKRYNCDIILLFKGESLYGERNIKLKEYSNLKNI